MGPVASTWTASAGILEALAALPIRTDFLPEPSRAILGHLKPLRRGSVARSGSSASRPQVQHRSKSILMSVL